MKVKSHVQSIENFFSVPLGFSLKTSGTSFLIEGFERWSTGRKVHESEIVDISDESAYPKIPMKNNTFFMIHHTAGRGDARNVMRVLNTRKGGPLSVQWIVDTDGTIYRGLPPNSKGAHVGHAEKRPEITNSNTQGVEVVGLNDADIKQRSEEDIAKYGYSRQGEAVRKIIKYLGYPKENVVTHGEVTSRKAKDEGYTLKQYVLQNWDKPIDLSGFKGEDKKIDPNAAANSSEFAQDKAPSPGKAKIDSDLVNRLITALKANNFSQQDLDRLIKIPSLA